MEFLNRLSTAKNTDQIVADLTNDCPTVHDLGILFISQQPYPAIKNIIEGLQEKISIKNFLSCTCSGIIGSHEEIERRPAASLILGKLPGVKIIPFTLTQAQLETLKDPNQWYDFFEVYPHENPIFIVLPDPFLFDMNQFMNDLQKAFPQRPIIGGLASAAMQSQGNTLILNKEFLHEGLVGVVLSGNVEVNTVVSQGCRPIGENYIVTKAEGNVVHQLGGKSFLETLRNVFEHANERDKLLAQEAIFVGIAMNEYKDEFKRGDFLIRMVVQIDPSTGAGIIGDRIKVGQTVQFHVRDAQSAREDLNILLGLQNLQNQKPKGALVFSCTGRGEHLFRQKNHDINMIQNQLGPIPAAGFFCAGEIGPVGNTNFIHGFTNSIALFYPHPKTRNKKLT